MQRVFIGIPVNGNSQRQINALLKTIDRKGRGLRWVPENNRHMTLAFLGEVADSSVNTLLRSFAGTYRHATRFVFRYSALRRFPGSDGRIVALTGEVTASMARLFQLTQRFLEDNDFAFDHRKPRPHITLARMSGARQNRGWPDTGTAIDMSIDRVTLYRSTLTEAGRTYLSLRESILG